jgi:acyl dehydratase
MYLEDFKVGDEFTSPGITLTLLGEASLGSPSTSKPDRGVVRMTYTTLNQRDEAVMSFIGTQLLKARSH